jgi:hypothetical protein
MELLKEGKYIKIVERGNLRNFWVVLSGEAEAGKIQCAA